MTLRRLSRAVAAALALVIAPVLAQPGPPGGKPPPMPVKVAPVKVGTVNVEISAVGTLLAEEAVMIRPEIAGRVTAIHFQEGQPVAAGAKLVTLEGSEFQAQLAASNAEATLNRSRHDRAKDLYAKGFISSQALDDARGNLDKSLAQQREIQVRLAKTEIRAPFAGVAGLRQVSPGAYVSAGQDIARLENIATIKADFRMPELYLGKLKAGQEVSVRVDTYADEHFAGRIFAIEPVVDEQTRTVLVRARVPNANGKLRPGMFARIGVPLERRENAMVVPEQAVVPRGKDTFVFRVVDGKAALTKVQIGHRTPGEVEIVQGLKPGETVVTEGQIKLQDGLPVAPAGQGPPGPPAAKGT
ncbi:MAG TPA: efflux RND transporter periplasmic adaptor subunit [Burkholderiales bacterium]